jgi:hypothetical protein
MTKKLREHDAKLNEDLPGTRLNDRLSKAVKDYRSRLRETMATAEESGEIAVAS